MTTGHDRQHDGDRPRRSRVGHLQHLEARHDQHHGEDRAGSRGRRLRDDTRRRGRRRGWRRPAATPVMSNCTSPNTMWPKAAAATSGIACTRSVPTSCVGGERGVEHQQQHHHQRARADRRRARPPPRRTRRSAPCAPGAGLDRSTSPASHAAPTGERALGHEADRREQQRHAHRVLHDVVDPRRDRRAARSTHTLRERRRAPSR